MAITMADYTTLESQTNHTYPMPDPECYIYFFHTGDYIILPTYPEIVSDSMAVSYTQGQVLGRSAPLQSYTGSGPRTIQFKFTLHRDVMWQVNYNNSSIIVEQGADDYVDQMAKKIQGAALPEYSTTEKMVSPPIIAVKIANEIFIKGVVGSSVGVVYQPPILRDGRFAQIEIEFSVTEVVPYSASQAMALGSYRNLDYTLGTNEVYTVGGTTETLTTVDYNGTKVTTATNSIQAQYFKNGNIGAEETV